MSDQVPSVWRRSRLTALAVLPGFVGLCAVGYAAAHPSPWVWSLPDWPFDPAPLPPIEPIEPGRLDQLPPAPDSGTWAWVFAVVGVIALLAAVFLLGRWIIRTTRAMLAVRVEAPIPDQLGTGRGLAGKALSAQQVTDAVEEALRRLDQAGDASDAVILAWLALEEAAARHGVNRSPSQTPTEFTAELLDRSAVPASDTVALRGLYWRARFSDLATTEADRRRARLCLEHIARGLERG